MKAKNEDKFELLSRMLVEAEECIGKDDSVQASEKLYKASEETIKELASRFELSESKEAGKRGRWTAPLLFRAVRRLSESINPEILNWWHAAWFLHVEGFHEARSDIEEVKIRVPHVRELISVVEK